MTAIVLISKVNFREFLFLFLISLPLSRFWMVRTDPESGMDKFKIWLPEYADTQHLVIWLVVVVLYFAFASGNEINDRPAQSIDLVCYRFLYNCRNRMG